MIKHETISNKLRIFFEVSNQTLKGNPESKEGFLESKS